MSSINTFYNWLTLITTSVLDDSISITLSNRFTKEHTCLFKCSMKYMQTKRLICKNEYIFAESDFQIER